MLRILNRPMPLNLHFHTPSAASASGCPEQLRNIIFYIIGLNSLCDSVQNYSTGEMNLVSISIRNAQLPSYLLFLKTVPLWEASFGAH